MDRIETEVVTEVNEDADGTTMVRAGSGIFGLEAQYKGSVKVGDAITCYMVQGCMIRGVDVNGKRLYYKTDEELDREHKEFCANLDRDREEAYAKNKDKIDKQIAGLSPRLKARMDRLIKEDPKFLVQDGSYELFVMVEADKIANHLRPKLEGDTSQKNIERVCKKFFDLPYTQQAEVVDEGHSGNTFGCAVQFAARVLMDWEC